MARITSLRLARRRRARAAARAKADAEAARHGEPKAARRLREAAARLEARRLDGHRRDDADGGE
jgi:hypothetical protein